MRTRLSGDLAFRRLVVAAINRIIPADDWPSASDAGVLTYLERQADGAHRHFWDDALAPGLAALDAEAHRRSGLAFAAMADADADHLLADVEAGTVAAWPGSSSAFSRRSSASWSRAITAIPPTAATSAPGRGR